MTASSFSLTKLKTAAMVACCLGAGLALLGFNRQQPEASGETCRIIVEGELGTPGNSGLQDLTAALQSRGVKVGRGSESVQSSAGITLLAGIASHARELQEFVAAGNLPLSPAPESYAVSPVRRGDQQVLAVAGSDERGLMYALSELARRVNHLGPRVTLTQWLSTLRIETGTPAVPVRGMVQFLHSSDLERSWYFDRAYWEEYLGMLARNRFNSFNLVFAHQTSYLAPPYPFLFDVEEYPQVRVPGLSAAEKHRNLETLQMISRLAREWGIDFIMGIWEQRAWKRGQTSMVEGLNDDMLADYARLAMQKLLRLCPDITGIQLRVNSESGIENPRQAGFFRDGIFAGIRASRRQVLLDLRGWGALPETVDAAVESGLPLRLSMKYWAEFMGMPYQAAQMLPSYSYADFLRYPRRYPVLYQVWSLGSHRLLPWGSVDWMKRFVPTTRLGGGIGFETCAPLSQKGFGNAPGEWRIFTSPEREYYRWEFQRYWLYYLLYGRLSYDPGSSEDLWMDEFRSRFGEIAASDIFDAFQHASEVIPFLVSYRLSNPNMYIWPEKQAGGVLDFFLEVKPADEARFPSFQEHVESRLRGNPSAKMSPEEAARRLNRMAEATERSLARADLALKTAENREYAANRIDLGALALLARYHARKILAAAALGMFYRTGHEASLESAKSHAAAALEQWERLVRLTDGVYHPAMVFGPQDTGHWKDNLAFVRHDVARLNEVQALLDRYQLFDLGLDFGPAVEVRRSEYEPQYASSYSIERRFRALDPTMTYDRQRGYGWLDAGAISASPPMSVPYASLEGDNLKDLALPSNVLYRDFLRGSRKATLMMDAPEGGYRITAIVANQPELAVGSFQIRASADTIPDSEPISFADAETGDKSMDVRALQGRLSLDFVPRPDGDWLVSGLIITRREPHIAHVPISSARPGSRIVVTATVTAPDGIEAAAVHLTAVDGRKPDSIPLLREGRQYQARVEVPQRLNGKTVGYFITAVDKKGHARRLPVSGSFEIPVGEDSEPPVFEHMPPSMCVAGQPLRLAFNIRDSSPIVLARLHYRHLSQIEKYRVLNLVRTESGYQAAVPGDFINESHDLMYYAEAVDRFGNGAFHPDPDRAAPYVVVKVRRSQ